MARAYLMEMSVFRDYARQLLGVGFLVAFFVSVGMGSIVAAPASLTMLFFMMGTAAAAAYDEQNDWGSFRLVMPLTRRDVVLGRYGVIVTLGLFGMASGLVAAFALVALATAAPLPLGLSEALAFRVDDALAALFATAVCLMCGAIIASIETPVYFKFGQSKATQWLPLVTVLLFVVPFVAINGTGVLDEGSLHMQTVAELLGFIESPAGVCAFFVAAVCVAAASLCASALVSLRIYRSRDL